MSPSESIGRSTGAPASARKRQRRDDVKQRLRAAIVELSDGIPYQELRVESIAEAAGLSRSAFYFYYRDKHELLMDSAGAVSEALYEQADRWWHGTGDPRELVATALEGAALTWLKNKDLLRLVIEVATYDDEVAEFWSGLVGRFVEATARHIEREQAVGRTDPRIDPQRTAEILIWGAERTMFIFISGERREPREVVEALADTWARVLYSRPR